MKFVFRISGGINCCDPDEDFDTDGPSSIIVRMKYLRASILIFWALCGKPMRQKALFYWFLFFGSDWILGGWGLVEWGRKSYLGPAEIISFSSRSFSQLNHIWFKCETPLLFFLITFYYISFDQQSPADVLQNRCP